MRRKLCQFIVALFTGAACAGVFTLSFLAVSSIGSSGAWSASDYWRGWFAVLSFLGGAAMAIAAAVAFAIFFGNLCDWSRR